MGDGLKKATLTTLCSRGPWTVDGVPCLEGEEVRKLHAAVAEGTAAMCAALGVDALSTRKADRALQLLRRAKLIKYDRALRTWLYA